MRRCKLAMFIVMSMSLCSCFDDNKKNNSDLFRQAHEAVKEHLKDPASAMFRNDHGGNNSGTICGEVNSKNSYGGYVGYSDYIYIAKDNSVTVSTGGPDFQSFNANTYGLYVDSEEFLYQLDKMISSCKFLIQWKHACEGKIRKDDSVIINGCSEFINKATSLRNKIRK